MPPWRYLYIKILPVCLLLFISCIAKSQWVQVGNLSSAYEISALTPDDSGNIYATGYMPNGPDGFYYLEKWNGQNWSVPGQIFDSIRYSLSPTLTSVAYDHKGNVYVAYTPLPQDYPGSTIPYDVLKWDGSKWSYMGLHADGYINCLITDAQGNLYAAGTFVNPYNAQATVAKWDGHSWSYLGGIANTTYGTITSITFDSQGNLYAAGRLTGSDGNLTVDKWDGHQWSPLNGLAPAGGVVFSIAADIAGNIYAIGFYEGNNSYAVSQWDRHKWINLGNLNANNLPRSLLADKFGYIYTAGSFTDSTGNNYVAKWDGNEWINTGHVGSGGTVFSLIADNKNNIYAGGYQSGLVYMLKGSSVPLMVDSIKVSTLNNEPSVIIGNNDSLQMVATIYPARENQHVIWSIVPVSGNATISGSGLVIPVSNGAVWAKAVSLADQTKSDSILITITGVVTPVDSVVVMTRNNSPAVIINNDGALQLVATVFPLTASQQVSWSIIPVSGRATIDTSGLVTATANGTVWAKAVSVEDATKSDSILITISGQIIPIDSVVIHTLDNAAPIITTKSGTLQMVAQVFPALADQAVQWTLIQGTGYASINNSGLVTAINDGTVWTKATSVQDNTKSDSMQITISGQAIMVDSVVVSVQNNLPAAINTLLGTLQLAGTVYPLSVDQNVVWSIVPIDGMATINATGLVNAIRVGTVWAKAVSVEDNAKSDSILISISNCATQFAINVYPNPVQNNLNINVSVPCGINIYAPPTTFICNYVYPPVLQVFNGSTGSLVVSHALHQNNVSIPVGNLSPGIYYIQLNAALYQTRTKFIKK